MSMNKELSIKDLAKAADIIASADALIIGAGAGMGVDSGLPDFRGNEGFWKAYPALAHAQMSFIEVANPRNFLTDPELAWGFYGHRLNLYRETAPHEGFSLLKEWADSKPLGAWIFTSNVDGQFQKAGLSMDQIHEVHGSIHHLQCIEDCKGEVWSADAFFPEIDTNACRIVSEMPRCPYCGAIARPNILMFGDWSWNSQRSDGQRVSQSAWLQSVDDALASVAIIEIGAGTVIPSVRHFSHQQIRERGAKLVRINPREPSVPSSRDVGFAWGATSVLLQMKAMI